MVGVLDHEMDVERQICELANNRHDSGAERNVIDEMSVHDVAMNPICPGLLNPAHFIGQSGKSAGEDGGGDQNPMPGVLKECSIEIMGRIYYSTTSRLRPVKLTLD